MTINVSIVIPAYNAALTLAEALDSVLAQTYPHWEAIIVDDGSTDATPEIAQRYAARDTRIRFFRQPNGGESAARNTGLRYARYDWLAFLDADDWISPLYLERMTEKLQSGSRLDAVHCASVRVALDGTLVSDDYQVPTGDLFPILACHVAFCVHACVLRRSFIDQVGDFDTSLKKAADWDFWQRVARTGAQFGAVREVLAYYRMTPNSSSLGAEQLFRDMLTVLKRGHAPDPRVRCPHPDHVNGLQTPTVENQEFYLLCWGAGLLLGSGSDARHLLEIVKDDRFAELDPDAIASCLFEAVPTPSCQPPRVWIELWPKIREEVKRFLAALEEQSQTPDLADQALAALEKRIRLCESPEEGLLEDYKKANGWQLHTSGGNAAHLVFSDDDLDTVSVNIDQARSATPWAVQLDRAGLKVQPDCRYALRFRARADHPRNIGMGVAKSHEPWTNLGLYKLIKLTPEWQEFQEEFTHIGNDEDARVHFDLAGSDISVKVSTVELRSLEDGIPASLSPAQFLPSGPRDFPATPGSQIENESVGMIPGMVTTIIPVYNRAGLLREAVGSVLAQTYDKIEVIIVDDGSTDETAAVCDELARAHSNVKVIHKLHEGRAGLAREFGRRAARGEYLQYLDSDDLLMPTKFSEMVAALEEHPDCDIAYCYTRRYRIGTVPEDDAVEWTGKTFDSMFPTFLAKRFWCTSTPIYRRSLCDKTGPWTDLPQWEDIEYDVRLATFQPRLYHHKNFLTDMRCLPNSLSDVRILDDKFLLSEVTRGAALIFGHIKSSALDFQNPNVRSFIDDVRLLYSRCMELGLTNEAQACAKVVMEATGIHDPNQACQFRLGARLELDVNTATVRPGESVCFNVKVVNDSTVGFHAQDFATELTYRLLGADGAVLQFDNASVLFEEPLPPGESRVVKLWVNAPSACGLYYIDFDILWAGITWLNLGTDSATFAKLLVSESILAPHWNFKVEDGNLAELKFPENNLETVRVVIEAIGAPVSWHVQLNRHRFSLASHQHYELRFSGRADAARQVAVGVSRARGAWDNLGLYREIDLTPEWKDFAMEFLPPSTDDQARVHFDMGGTAISVEIRNVLLVRIPGGERVVPAPMALHRRLQMDIGTHPANGSSREGGGRSAHQYYLDKFLTEFAADVHGHCLAVRGKSESGLVETSDTGGLSIDASLLEVAWIEDLTKSNHIASDRFDCILCIHAAQTVINVEPAIGELFRILKPGGVLLIAAPLVSGYGLQCRDLCRLTPKGMEVLLSRSFGPDQILVRSYGNSLTAAGEIRGSTESEFLRGELENHDPRFPVEVCARAQKPT